MYIFLISQVFYAREAAAHFETVTESAKKALRKLTILNVRRRCVLRNIFPFQVKPGDKVFDYCAGSGGKTLAFGPQMQNKGKIYLHDVRERMLQEAKKRLKRAGITNYTIVQPESPILPKLAGVMDWVSIIRIFTIH